MHQHSRNSLWRWGSVIQALALTGVVLVGLCTAVLLEQPTRVYACTPPLPPWPPEATPRDYVSYSGYIFTGQVISTSAPFQQFSPFYSATIQLSETLKGTLTVTQVIVAGFGTSALCKTDIAAGPDTLLFFAAGPSVDQLNIVYRLSGPIDRAGVFPVTQNNLDEVRYPFRVWLPAIFRP